RDVDHEETQRLADLRGREPHAGRGVHRLGHVLHELLELGTELGHGAPGVAQALVGVVEDRADGHGSRYLILRHDRGKTRAEAPQRPPDAALLGADRAGRPASARAQLESAAAYALRRRA